MEISEGCENQYREQRGKTSKINKHGAFDDITNKTNWPSRIDRVCIRGPFSQLINGKSNTHTDPTKLSCAEGSRGSSECDIQIVSTTSLEPTNSYTMFSEGQQQPCNKTDYCEADSTVGVCLGNASMEPAITVVDIQAPTTWVVIPSSSDPNMPCSYTSTPSTSERNIPCTYTSTPNGQNMSSTYTSTPSVPNMPSAYTSTGTNMLSTYTSTGTNMPSTYTSTPTGTNMLCTYTSTPTVLSMLGSQYVNGTFVSASINGQAILYVKQGPQVIFNVNSTKQMKTKPSPQAVQSIVNSDDGPGKSDGSISLSATCDDVASHPLLQLNHTPLQNSSKDTQCALKNVEFPVKDAKDMQVKSVFENIPQNSHVLSLSDRATLPCLSLETDELTDLLSLKLSPSLKDIDAPVTEAASFKDGHGVGKGIVPEKRIVSKLTFMNTLPANTSNWNRSFYRLPSVRTEGTQHGGERESIANCAAYAPQTPAMSSGRLNSTSTSTQTIEVHIISPEKSKTKQNAEEPSNDLPEGHLHPKRQDQSSTHGSKCELLKETPSKRIITIPISGLPQDLFKLDVLGTGLAVPDKAMVRLETSESGIVTGYLILPYPDRLRGVGLES